MKPQSSTTVVIMQPYFLPYRNYYGLIQKADYFVIFDDVQFTYKWQQRNNILCQNGKKRWITVPVISKRPAYQLIKDVQICNEKTWQGRMLARIRLAYKDHPYFDYVYPELEMILRKQAERLVELTVSLLRWSASKMGIHLPKWYWSSEIGGKHLGRTERLVYICQLLGATEYLVGPAAKAYLDETLFEEAGIHVLWHEDSYPGYAQLLSKKLERKFDHYVSVLDLLMNHGSESVKYLEPCNESRKE